MADTVQEVNRPFHPAGSITALAHTLNGGNPCIYPAGSKQFRETILPGKYGEVVGWITQIVLAIAFPVLATLVLDGWTNIHGQSIWVFIAVIPEIGPLVLEVLEASADITHDGVWFAGDLWLSADLCTCRSSLSPSSHSWC